MSLLGTHPRRTPEGGSPEVSDDATHDVPARPLSDVGAGRGRRAALEGAPSHPVVGQIVPGSGSDGSQGVTSREMTSRLLDQGGDGGISHREVIAGPSRRAGPDVAGAIVMKKRKAMTGRFQNRTEAGRDLSRRLAEYANRPDVLVLALPRGGVPVGFEVARCMKVPLDVFMVRKLGVPGHEELAMGALATGGVRFLNEEVVRALRISDEVIDTVAASEHEELERRSRLYRGDRPAPDVRGRTVILVDDGLATGTTMRSAVVALRRQQAGRLIVAVPVAAPSTCEEFEAEVDQVVCARTPEPFYAVGLWYEDFSQTTDDEVRDLLELAEHPQGSGTHEP